MSQTTPLAPPAPSSLSNDVANAQNLYAIATVAVGGGPIPSGAATAAKQDTGNSSLATIASNTTNAGAPAITSVDLGAKADTAATTDSGTFSLIALFKRLLGKIPSLGAGATAASVPVNIASDQVSTLALAADLGSHSSTTVPATPSTAATLIDKITGFWGALGNLTDAATSVWDTTSSTVTALLKGIGGMINVRIPVKGQATMANSTPVTLASDQSPATVVGQFIRIDAADFTRPGTTGTYAAGQVYGPVTTPAVLTFTNVARANGGSGLIKAALLNLQWPSGTPVNTGYALRLKLFNVAPTPIADGSLWTVLKTNFLSWMGSFDFSGLNAEGATYTGSDSIHGMGAPVAGSADADISFVCAANSRNLYGVLVAEGAFTQVASQVATVSLIVDQN